MIPLETLAGPVGYALLAGIGAGWLIVALVCAIVGRKDRAEASKSPAWMGRLGHALAAQFHRVDQTHRFTGDRVVVIDEQTYSGGGKSFLVSVKRKEPQNERP